jgi:iron complex outermembrane receptor protein
VVGLQAESGRFSALGDEAFAPASRTRSQALFVHEEMATAWGAWSVGGRVEQLSVNSFGNPDVDRFETGDRRFSPKSVATGLTYRLGSGWRLLGNAAYSERAPKDYELFANGPHVATAAYEVGNSSLGIEKARSLDLGLAWVQGANRLNVSAFIHHFANYIGLLATGDEEEGLPVQRYQAVRALFNGLEVSGNWRLLQSAGTLDLQGRADVTRANNLSNDESLPRISPLRLGTKLVYAQGPWSARVGFEHVAAQNRVPAGSVSTTAYTLWNLGLGYRQTVSYGQVHWFARIDNLTDQLAWSATSILTSTAQGKAPLPGRTLKLGVQWQF